MKEARMKNTENAEKKALISKQILFLLITLSLLNSFLPLLLEFFALPGVAIEIIYYVCDLLSLGIECFAIGLGILHLAKKNCRSVLFSLLFVRLIAWVATFAATLLYSVFYAIALEYDFFTVFFLYEGTALLNLLIAVLIDAAVLLLLWLLFFWKRPLPVRYANITATLCLLLIKLAGLLPDTIGRFVSSAPNLPPYLGSIIFDYVFLLISLGLAYLLLCVIQAYLSPEESTSE